MVYLHVTATLLTSHNGGSGCKHLEVIHAQCPLISLFLPLGFDVRFSNPFKNVLYNVFFFFSLSPQICPTIHPWGCIVREGSDMPVGTRQLAAPSVPSRMSILPEQPSMDDGGDNTAEPCVNVIDILSLCIPSLLPYSYVSHNKSQHFRFSVRLDRKSTRLNSSHL